MPDRIYTGRDYKLYITEAKIVFDDVPVIKVIIECSKSWAVKKIEGLIKNASSLSPRSFQTNPHLINIKNECYVSSEFYTTSIGLDNIIATLDNINNMIDLEKMLKKVERDAAREYRKEMCEEKVNEKVEKKK